MFLLFQGGIFRFHVCFQGCNQWHYGSWSPPTGFAKTNPPRFFKSLEPKARYWDCIFLLRRDDAMSSGGLGTRSWPWSRLRTCSSREDKTQGNLRQGSQTLVALTHLGVRTSDSLQVPIPGFHEVHRKEVLSSSSRRRIERWTSVWMDPSSAALRQLAGKHGDIPSLSLPVGYTPWN